MGLKMPRPLEALDGVVRRLEHAGIGVEAVKAGRSVYFCTLADLLDQLAGAEREGRLQDRIRFFARAALLVVDAGAQVTLKGYLPVVPGGGNLFFQPVNARYERGAMILTSNRGFAEWARCSAIRWSPPPCSTGCCITLLSCRSRARATGSASTPNSCPSRSALRP